MRKIVVILGSLLVGGGLASAGLVVHALLNPLAPADQTSNINVMLTRPADWYPLGVPAVITEEEMMLVDGSTATIPITAELLRQFYDYTDDQVVDALVVSHSTTHNAYVNLIDQVARTPWGLETEDRPVSLILVTPPSAEEEAYARAAGVSLDLAPVAKDGFVFITHRDNPVDSLTADQVRGIYTGAITNWSQVGGEDRAIRAYQREANSGSQTAMENLVMAGQPMIEPIATQVSWGMGSLIDAVAEFDNGPASIGYTYLYYLENLYLNDQVKVLRIDDVAPDELTIQQGDYPFATAYQVVIRADEPTDSPARRLRDFLLSEAGQDLVEMAGYIRAVNR